jgi:hypothetical protein
MRLAGNVARIGRRRRRRRIDMGVWWERQKERDH